MLPNYHATVLDTASQWTSLLRAAEFTNIEIDHIRKDDSPSWEKDHQTKTRKFVVVQQQVPQEASAIKALCIARYCKADGVSLS